MTILSRGILFSIFVLTSVFLLSNHPAIAQPNNSIDYQKLIHQLEREVKDGKRKALRDLGSLLDKPAHVENITKILKSHTFFTPEEFDVTAQVQKTAFLDFFYENESNIKFSETLQGFYLTPLEYQASDYKIRHPQKEENHDPSILLRRLIRTVENGIASGSDEVVLSQFELIPLLRTKESYEFILSILTNEHFYDSKLENPERIVQVICEELINYPNERTFQVILDLVKKEIVSAEFAAPILSKITNISVTKDGRYADLVSRYEFWSDSLKTIGEMKHFGYEMVISFKPTFFQFSVDYYGKILSSSNDYPWILHNALNDIVQTQNPRALFYLAALAWRHRNSDAPDKNFQTFVNQLEKLADLKVAVQGKAGLSSTHDWQNDEEACRNLLTYWASHYQDYEWDDIRKSFMNKEEAIALKENYERLFRRLNSENDSVALQSYLLLTEGDPIEILGLSRKYKELLRNYNASLPSFKHKYLEQLVVLTDFCRRNGFRYKAPPRLSPLLEELKNAPSPSERYRIENQIIKRLVLDEVTALEYWGCIQENNPSISFSVGRILDWFYSKNWDRIVDDIENLRLYLKKAHLFKNIGAQGICNVYLNKFYDYDGVFQTQLKEILAIESDEDIIFQIKELLAQLEGGTSESLSDFLENPDFFMPNDIKKLPPPSKNFRNKIVQSINASTNKYHQKNWLLYLNEYPDISLAPKLFEWLERNIQPYVIAKTIEKIFDHSLKGDPRAWLSLWQEDGENYLSWTQQFFEEKLLILTTEETLSVKDVNAVLQSPLFEQKYKVNCLTALKKIRPVRDIRRLKIDGWLSVQEDLVYFNKIELGYKYLDDISRLFDLSEDAVFMVDWLMQKTSNYSVEDRGSFFNNLFQKNWFFDFTNNSKIAPYVAEEIKLNLENYLAESDFISEFEEQTTIKNIALLENLGKSLEEKIVNTLRLNVDENSKLSIEEAILARINFEDLPIAIKYLNDLNIVRTYNFLSRDFGLPVFDLQNPETQQALLDNYKKKKPFELYAHYLEAFGVDFKTPSGDLDFNKIYKILQYDIVMPFVGSGGKKRDYYTYGTIKLLEYHFRTRLGFHEKLNENQTFYTFNSTKRANAWMNYLVENGWVKESIDETPSFNTMVKE